MDILTFKPTKAQQDVLDSMKLGSVLAYYKTGALVTSRFQLQHKHGTSDKVNGKVGYALVKSGLLLEIFHHKYGEFRSDIKYILK